MITINFGRLMIGGLIATVILFLTDGVFHEHVFRVYWEYLYEALGAHETPMSHGIAVLYFFVFELGRGFLAILIYVLMRPFQGAGPKTAVFAAVVAWMAFSVAGPAQFIPLGLFEAAVGFSCRSTTLNLNCRKSRGGLGLQRSWHDNACSRIRKWNLQN
ncbi:MAG: hypothetical protein ABIO36_08500 [Pyrinomonadaceae bacterium]